jgi:hypothetical protein
VGVGRAEMKNGNSQVVLPLECLAAHAADVFSFITMRQFVLGKR